MCDLAEPHVFSHEISTLIYIDYTYNYHSFNFMVNLGIRNKI